MIETSEYGDIELSVDQTLLKDLFLFCSNNGISISILPNRKVRLTFRDHVGIFKIGQNQINIRPKFSLISFLYILSRSSLYLDAIPKNVVLTGSEFSSVNIIRIFISLFEGFLNRGLMNDYISKEEEMNHIRGSIITTSIQYPWKLHKFDCIYEDFTIDNQYNQVIRYAIKFLQKISYSIDSYSFTKLSKIDSRLRLIKILKNVESSTIDLLLKKLPQRFSHYYSILSLCHLILSGKSISEFGSSIMIVGFILRMNRLYENFVLTMSRLHLPQYNIFSRKFSINAISGLRKQLIFYKPDVIVKSLKDSITSPVLIADAKYKPINIDKERLDIDKDFYQILSYCVFMGSKKGILFYPTEKIDQYNPVIISLRELDVEIRLISLQLGGNDWFTIDNALKSTFNKIDEWLKY